ncbi:sialate O-acetylesterase [Cesiribacter andamanensis]|uniref:Sialate O-acetylesterase domain-containing protein n=1 Tax=Cesiribacter andamanensis AMV16 TaxID=1279009 RepID=M7N0Y2_9BACT|nr:sialate O-acetylesterase [Cesiribacter andamanensis]EMR00967.1 hypothetical protein ADICEAN_03909 [Cesiribacter andamanensis AMV16]
MKHLTSYLPLLLALLLLQACKAPATMQQPTAPAATEVQDETPFALAGVLQSGMVIQQDKPFRLWGTAPAGSSLRIQASWHPQAVQAQASDSGSWMAEIPVPAATPGNFDAHTIHIVREGDALTLTDLLIGEVWLCSGQSNMDMEMKAKPPWLEGVLNFEEEIAAANHPAMRYINIQKGFTKTPQPDAKGTWQPVTPQTAGDLSGVAYYYGRQLLQELQVPVGLVVSSFGGSAAQAWTSREALSADPYVKQRYLDPYDQSTQPTESLDSIQTLEKLFEVLARPTLLYNAMIHPLTPLSIRGFLWYQGESNKLDGADYTPLSAAQIRGWRKAFGQGELPFYFVQMTPYNWEETDSTATYYARLREAQEAILAEVPNTGMAVTMNVGEIDNIHPRDKKSVGERLARLALHHTYNQKGVQHLGPVYESFTVKGAVVQLRFKPESIGSGLTTSDGKPPRHFYLAGEDRIFYPAKATIVGNEVRLESDKVKKPVAIRYAFTNYPLTNFGNKDGLPAQPFRTDRWEEPKP